MDLAKRGAVVGAAAIFLLTLYVYARSMTPTVPFWDSGEFIATSYILGIPHPPGTPLYVILGRLASMWLPWASVAQRVNGLSAVASALAVALTFLVTLKLIRLCQPAPRTKTDEIVAWLGGIVAALMLAFSDTFWENGTEAEVYAMMSLAQILVFWLGLKWWEAHEVRPTIGPLLLITYVMWLCVGLHLGVGLMGLPLLLLMAMLDMEVAILFALPYLSVMLVAMGLERMAAGALAVFLLQVVIFARRGTLSWAMTLGVSAVCLYAMYLLLSPTAGFHPLMGLLTVAAIVTPVVLLALRTPQGKILALAIGLVLLGYSVHFYLPIRAAQRPAINEGAPATWNALRDELDRKQYGQTSMFVRRGTLQSQLDKEFWRYVKRQWPLFPGGNATPYLLPLGLGLVGLGWQARRERRSFVLLASFAFLSSAGLILFLNFSDKEVRDRDYFFTSFYHAYAMWIGMGAAVTVTWLRDSFAQRNARVAMAGAGSLLMLVQPVLLLRHHWFSHDRSRNFVAHDYAYNMLQPLKPNAFIFTNGDNDTFPLWYMQEVENLRKDVRVVNLSLLQTDWYIRQLRDDPPKLPIELDDRSIDVLGRGAFLDTLGNLAYTQPFMVNHLINTNRWRLPVYFAVTVPDHMGWDPHLTLEGLVYRVNPDTLQSRVDYEAVRHNLYQVYRYGGLFLADGSWDSTVFKDDQAATLSRNYAAAHVQLAFGYRRSGRLDFAIAEMERVRRMFPNYVEALIPLGGLYMEAKDTAKAMVLYQDLLRASPRDPELLYTIGLVHMFQRDTADALRRFQEAIQADPTYPYPYYSSYELLWSSGHRLEAVEQLRRLSEMAPEDPTVRNLLSQRERELGIAPSFTPGAPSAPGAPQP